MGEVEPKRPTGWEQAIQALSAGFLARWDRHDPRALEEAVRTLTLAAPEPKQGSPRLD